MTKPISRLAPHQTGPVWDTGTSEDGPAVTDARPLDRNILTTEGSGPMAIVPETPPSVMTTPNLSPFSRVDGCPEACGNTETPRDAEPTCEGYRAVYLCSDCGVEWYTSWGA